MRHYDSRHIRILAPANIMVVMSDVWWFVGLGVWSAAIVMAIKPLHAYLVNKGCEDMVAVYYNRKVAHMLAGGVPILASPIVFTDPMWPLLGGLIGAAVLASTHILDRRLWWMQTCLLYTSPSPRDATLSRMPSSA